MNPQQIWFAFGMLACFVIFISLFNDFGSSPVGASVLIFSVLVLLLACWLTAIHDYQFKPHHVTSSINGRVISDFWTTNPAYVTFRHSWVASANGLELVNTPETNFWWHQWRIFR